MIKKGTFENKQARIKPETTPGEAKAPSPISPQPKENKTSEKGTYGANKSKSLFSQGREVRFHYAKGETSKAFVSRDACFVGVFHERAELSSPIGMVLAADSGPMAAVFDGGFMLKSGSGFFMEVKDAPGHKFFCSPPMLDAGAEIDDEGYGVQNLIGGPELYPSSLVRADMVYIPIGKDRVCPISILSARSNMREGIDLFPQAGVVVSGGMTGIETKIFDKPYPMTPGKAYNPYVNDKWIDWTFSTPQSDCRVIILSLNERSK